MNETTKTKKYNVVVKRISPQHAVVEAHGQKMTLAIQGNDPNLGFTSPETVLAAFGACILSNVNRGAAAMGLQVDDARVEFSATKRLEPLGYEDLQYTLTLHSPESLENLQALYERATTNGTATNALLEGLKPQGSLNIQQAVKQKRFRTTL